MTIIYHYCDAAAFVSIIESGKLRLTHARKTNDRHERDFFKEKAFEHIVQLAKQHTSLDSFHELLDKHFDLIENLSDFHICCLSKQRDSVGQWATYADRGAGFAIGFDINALRMVVGATILDNDYAVSPMESAESDWLFAPVIYGDAEGMKPHLDKIASFGFTGWPEVGDTQPAWNYINRMCAFFKHPAFKEENEWRIIYDATRQSEILWRYGKYGLTPYCETPDISSCIREVVIGPSCLDREAEVYVSRFLESHTIDAKVEKSQSPYR